MTFMYMKQIHLLCQNFYNMECRFLLMTFGNKSSEFRSRREGYRWEVDTLSEIIGPLDYDLFLSFSNVDLLCDLGSN